MLSVYCSDMPYTDRTNSGELNKKALLNRLPTSMYWVWTTWNHMNKWIKGLFTYLVCCLFYAQWCSWAPECAKLSVKFEKTNLSVFPVNWTDENKHFYRLIHKMLRIDRQRNWIFATNSNILIPISLQPNAAYRCYFKQWFPKDKII